MKRYILVILLCVPLETGIIFFFLSAVVAMALWGAFVWRHPNGDWGNDSGRIRRGDVFEKGMKRKRHQSNKEITSLQDGRKATPMLQ